LRPKSKDEHNAELRQDAARIVAGVENYSGADKMKRAAEVRAAFPPVKPIGSAAKTTAKAKAATKSVAKTTTKATAKPAAKPAAKKRAARATGKTAGAVSKGPTPAGVSVGRHDGDVC
jgi:hypothetical protein